MRMRKKKSNNNKRLRKLLKNIIQKIDEGLYLLLKTDEPTNIGSAKRQLNYWEKQLKILYKILLAIKLDLIL